MQPKTLDALTLLLRRAGETVTREELTEALWPGVFVTDNSLDQMVARLRKALGDNDRPRRYLETVPRRGFRWVGPAESRSEGRAAALPAPVARFVGREAEIARIREALGRSRLVTLVGPGGAGKTQLALRVAPTCDPRAAFVDLVPARTRRGVVQAVLEAVGLGSAADPESPGALDALRGLDTLLVIDNAEHVAEHAAWLAGGLLDGGRIRLLVTSRERLRLDAEHLVEVGPMPPRDALALLAGEAAARGISTPDDAVLGALVQRLDGLPLALTLAAAALRMWSPEALLERLERSTGWLWADSRGHPERQGSLRHAFLWSWELLAPEDRTLLSQCTAFRGPFSPEAAEAVLGAETLPRLYALRDRSMIGREDPASGSRLRMYPPLREIAEQAMPLPREQIERHAVWFASRREEAERSGSSRGVHPTDSEELWAAWERVEDRALRVRVGLALALTMRFLAPSTAPEAVLGEALAIAEPDEIPGLLVARAMLRRSNADRSGAIADARAALAALPAAPAADRAIEANANVIVAWHILEIEGDPDAAEAHGRRALALARPGSALEARMLGMYGSLLSRSSRHAEAEPVLARAIELARRIGADRVESTFGVEHGMCLYALDLPERAEAAYRATLALHRRHGNVFGITQALVTVAESAIVRDAPEEAQIYLEEALALTRGVGPNVADICYGLGTVRLVQGDRIGAREHFQRHLAGMAAEGKHLGEAEGLLVLAALDLAEDRCEVALGTLDRALAAAERSAFAIVIAFAHNARAIALAGLGRTAEARDAMRGEGELRELAEYATAAAEGGPLPGLPPETRGWTGLLRSVVARWGAVRA